MGGVVGGIPGSGGIVIAGRIRARGPGIVARGRRRRVVRRQVPHASALLHGSDSLRQSDPEQPHPARTRIGGGRSSRACRGARAGVVAVVAAVGATPRHLSRSPPPARAIGLRSFCSLRFLNNCKALTSERRGVGVLWFINGGSVGNGAGTLGLITREPRKEERLVNGLLRPRELHLHPRVGWAAVGWPSWVKEWVRVRFCGIWYFLWPAFTGPMK